MKSFINKHFIIKYKNSFGLNSAKLRKDWFIKNGYKRELIEIFKKTNFLKDVSLSERIYCIINDIFKKEKCPYCDKDVKYANFIEGYRRHCGNRECSYLDKKTFKHEDGLTSDQRSGKGISLSQKEIQQNGKTKAHNSSIKGVENKRKHIINGKNMLQIAAERAANTKAKTIKNGLNLSQLASAKAAKTMDAKLVNGKTIKQQRILNMILTKEKIGEDGLDGFERAFLHGAGKNSSLKYFRQNLYYQGEYEKYFLDFMEKHNEIKNIKRGNRFVYLYNGQKRQYRTDFLYKNNIIFEIKSSWTYGKNDDELRNKNHIKFKSVIDDGFRLFVIFDKKYFIEVTSINLKKNLYEEKFKELSNLFNNI